MLSCKEVTRLIASDEFMEAGWSTRLSVRIHLLMCVNCRRYRLQLQAIGEAARELFSIRSESNELITVQRLEGAILRRIAD